MADGLGHFRDGLHTGGTRADHRNALAVELHRFLRPVMSVAGLAAEALDAGEARHCRRRQHANGGYNEPRIVAPAILQDDLPAARVLLIMRRRDAALELDVAAQVELVGNMVQIALGLGLTSEMLLPVPFLQEFLRKGVAIGPALRIEACAGIAVPVPGAADAGAGLEHPHLEAEFTQLIELLEPGNAGTDDDCVEIRARIRPGLVRGRLRVNHALIPCTDACGNSQRKTTQST